METPLYYVVGCGRWWCALHSSRASSTTTDSFPAPFLYLIGSTSLTESTSVCASRCTSVSSQHSVAPGYLVDLCRPVASIDSHKHLRSANRGQLQVPRIRMSTYGSCAFGHAGPSTWNALPNILKCNTRFLPAVGRHLKLFYARQLYRQVLLRARISYGNSVRLFVCPSRPGTERSPGEIETPGLHHMIA